MIFGLGYNLLVFVYEKYDTNDSCILHFKYCTFIDKLRTADFTITKRFIDKHINIMNCDFFTLNFKTLIGNESNILIIGNPPWVTNRTLSLLESKKMYFNFKNLVEENKI